MSSFASLESHLNSFVPVGYVPFLTFYMMMLSSLPSNGGIPVRRIYMMTPIDHKSHFSSYFLLNKISGAM